MWTDLQDRTEVINKRLINIMKKSQLKTALRGELIGSNQIRYLLIYYITN